MKEEEYLNYQVFDIIEDAVENDNLEILTEKSQEQYVQTFVYQIEDHFTKGENEAYKIIEIVPEDIKDKFKQAIEKQLKNKIEVITNGLKYRADKTLSHNGALVKAGISILEAVETFRDHVDKIIPQYTDQTILYATAVLCNYLGSLVNSMFIFITPIISVTVQNVLSNDNLIKNIDKLKNKIYDFEEDKKQEFYALHSEEIETFSQSTQLTKKELENIGLKAKILKKQDVLTNEENIQFIQTIGKISNNFPSNKHELDIKFQNIKDDLLGRIQTTSKTLLLPEQAEFELQNLINKRCRQAKNILGKSLHFNQGFFDKVGHYDKTILTLLSGIQNDIPHIIMKYNGSAENSQNAVYPMIDLIEKHLPKFDSINLVESAKSLKLDDTLELSKKTEDSINSSSVGLGIDPKQSQELRKQAENLVLNAENKIQRIELDIEKKYKFVDTNIKDKFLLLYKQSVKQPILKEIEKIKNGLKDNISLAFNGFLTKVSIKIFETLINFRKIIDDTFPKHADNIIIYSTAIVTSTMLAPFLPIVSILITPAISSGINKLLSMEFLNENTRSLRKQIYTFETQKKNEFLNHQTDNFNKLESIFHGKGVPVTLSGLLNIGIHPTKMLELVDNPNCSDKQIRMLKKACDIMDTFPTDAATLEKQINTIRHQTLDSLQAVLDYSKISDEHKIIIQRAISYACTAAEGKLGKSLYASQTFFGKLLSKQQAANEFTKMIIHDLEPILSENKISNIDHTIDKLNNIVSSQLKLNTSSAVNDLIKESNELEIAGILGLNQKMDTEIKKSQESPSSGIKQIKSIANTIVNLAQKGQQSFEKGNKILAEGKAQQGKYYW